MSEPRIPWPDEPLSSGRVALRRWREDEAAAMHAAYREPSIQERMWPWERPYELADAADYLALLGLGKEIAFAITEPGRDAALGSTSLFAFVPQDARASIGYWLLPEARGRGLASGAVRLLAGWALGAMGLARLELTCAPDNVASQRVAQACGFTREGLLRSHLAFRGGRRDTVLFGLLAGELR